MIGEMKIQGVIEPSLSGEELSRAWEIRAFIVGAPLADLKTDGATIEIRYELWDTENLKPVFQIEVNRVGGRICLPEKIPDYVGLGSPLPSPLFALRGRRHMRSVR